MQWRIVGKDGIIVEVMEVVGVEGSRVLFERYLPLHDTVLKRYRVAPGCNLGTSTSACSCEQAARRGVALARACSCRVCPRRHRRRRPPPAASPPPSFLARCYASGEYTDTARVHTR